MENNSTHDNLTYEQTRQNIFDNLSIEEAIDRTRDLIPTIILLLGGTGSDIGRRIKKLIKERKLGKLVRFIVLDTDASSRAAQGSLPGFSRSEFIHLTLGRLKTALRALDRHPEIAKRFGFGNGNQSLEGKTGIAPRSLAKEDDNDVN